MMHIPKVSFESETKSDTKLLRVCQSGLYELQVTETLTQTELYKKRELIGSHSSQ